MTPLAANARLRYQAPGGTLLLQLIAAFVTFAGIVTTSVPTAVLGVLLFTFAVASLHRDVLQCDFTRLLPGHRGMPRRLLVRIALVGGLLAGVAGRDGSVLVGALEGTAVSLVTAALTMWNPAMALAILLILRQVWVGAISAEALCAVSVPSILVAWRLLDSRVLESWVDRASNVSANADLETQRRNADAAAARGRATTLADLVVRAMASGTVGTDLRAMGALVVSNAGRYPAVLVALVPALIVLFGGDVIATTRGGGYVAVLYALSWLPGMLLGRARVPQALPIGRRRLMRANLLLIACAVVACEVLLFATAGAADLAALIVAPADTMPVASTSLWRQGPVLVLPAIVGATAAPLQRTRFGTFSYTLLMLACTPTAVAVSHAGIMPLIAGAVVCASLAYAAVRQRYARGDLT
jgi:hypothetical protein